MPRKSPYRIDIPQVNILTYLFGSGNDLSNTPLWIDSADESINLSMKQMFNWSKRLAIGLDQLGIKPGSVVLIYSPNHIYIPAAYLGIVGSGRIFSGVNPIYTLPEVVHQIKNTEAQVILVHPSLAKTAMAAAKQVNLPSNRVFLFSDSVNKMTDGIRDWREMIGSEQAADRYSVKQFTPAESISTIATVNYSSGTTGMPKGVMISHSALIANVEQNRFMLYHHMPAGIRDHPPERWVGFLPLYHAYGQLFAMGMAAKLQVPIYIMKQFVLTDFLEVIQNKKITTLQVAPPILVMLSKRSEVKNYDISSVKSSLCGAAPLSKELQNDVSRRFNIQINQGWGMTEVTCGAMTVPVEFSDDSGSVGVPFPNTEVKLLDDSGHEVTTAGERGELYVRGPQVCLGYWKNAEATRETLDEEGWLKTGDVALFDEKGWFWIVDRKKELIKVNGLQVAPAELEAVLLTHPDIADAAVVGITLHEEEYPRAYIVLKEGASSTTSAESIQSWIQTRVARHKWLTGGIKFIDEVPKLASGKITRKVMREWARRDVGEMEGVVRARL